MPWWKTRQHSKHDTETMFLINLVMFRATHWNRSVGVFHSVYADVDVRIRQGVGCLLYTSDAADE